jgi:site-specific recombinase XerD
LQDRIIRVSEESKSRKERYVRFSEITLKAIKQYLRLKYDNAAEVFTCYSKYKKRNLSRQSIFNMIKELGEYCGIINLHPHSLRHSFATQLIIAGMSITSVKQMLGHQSINTTMKYIHLLDRTSLLEYDNYSIMPKVRA